MDLAEFENDLTDNLMDEFGSRIQVWVWPELDGVKGFYGSGEINNAVVIWITERPAIGPNRLKPFKFPDWMDTRFYSSLKAEGLENMHFTDFVKIMDTAGKRPTGAELKISAEWMRKEIEMLRINDKKLIIIANSRNTEKWMDEYLPGYPSHYHPFFKNLLRFGKANLLKGILSETYRMTI